MPHRALKVVRTCHRALTLCKIGTHAIAYDSENPEITPWNSRYRALQDFCGASVEVKGRSFQKSSRYQVLTLLQAHPCAIYMRTRNMNGCTLVEWINHPHRCKTLWQKEFNRKRPYLTATMVKHIKHGPRQCLATLLGWPVITND